MARVFSKNRLKILFFPAWYPSESSPIRGIFIKEHAKAASLYNDVVVLYAYPDPATSPKGFYRISDDIEDGIRTIRVRYGGILRYLLRRLLLRQSEAKQPLSPTGSGNNRFSSLLKRMLRIPRAMGENLLYYVSIFAAFHKLVKRGWRPDIINAHVSSAGLVASILGKLYRIPVVISEQGAVLPRHLSELSPRVRARFAMNRARIVLAPSEVLRKNIKACGVKNEIQIVPNVVNTELFYLLSVQNKNERKRMLLVAQLAPVKGVPYLLQALAQVKGKRQDFVLDIVGNGLRSEYEELARSLGLGEMVRFHGLKLKQEVAVFMRSCDFLVLPSLSENVPCVLIEAMACGKPVIASDVGGVKELVTEENSVLIPPKDVEALSKAIEYMLDNSTDYPAEKIAQYAKERFSYEVVGEMLDRIYRRVLDKG